LCGVQVWDASTRQPLFRLEGRRAKLRHVAFSPDGRLLASASDDTAVRVWDLTTRRLLHTLDEHTQGVCCLSFGGPSARAPLLGSASTDGTVRVWDIATGRRVLLLRGPRYPVRGVAFSPAGDRLATAGEDGPVRVWDARTGKEV